MQQQSVHEPNAPLMSAADVWDDAQRISKLLQRKQSIAEPIIRLPIPFSILLSALEQFSRDELMMVHQRIEERLAT